MEKTEIKEALDKLIAEYNERQGGIYLQEVAGGFQFRTRPELEPLGKKAQKHKACILYLRRRWKLWPLLLTGSRLLNRKLKVFAVWMSALRSRDFWKKSLFALSDARMCPASPLFMEQPKRFLEVFNLKDLSDLPNLRELKELNEQQELLEQEIVEQKTTNQKIYSRSLMKERLQKLFPPPVLIHDAMRKN